jgi:uncharacterized protein (TIGR02646 family)
VIPVQPQEEPSEFDARVRQRGKTWILKKNLNPNDPLPNGIDYPKPAYWAKQRDNYSCLEQLYEAYQRVCSYTGLYITSGAKSVDHFVPKSRLVGLAFEWSNYRLACRNINSSKQDFEDVLDPFFLESEVFFLDLDTGKIYVNPALEKTPLGNNALQTISRLRLWTEQYNNMRADYFTAFKNGDISASFLKTHALFVYLETQRQGQL